MREQIIEVTERGDELPGVKERAGLCKFIYLVNFIFNRAPQSTC